MSVNNSGRQTNVPSSTLTSLMALVWFSRWLTFLFPLTGVCFISFVCFLEESAVDCVLSAFLNLKALGPAATMPGSVHFTFPSVPQKNKCSCMQAHTHISTHGAGAGAGLHICSSAEACTSFFNARVTSHPRRLSTVIQTTSSLICSRMQTNKNTRTGLQIN